MTTLEEALASFSEKKVAVFGDVILDKFSEGVIERQNPENPLVPVVKITSSHFMLGGAANVAHNISTLGASCVLYGACATDPAGLMLRHLFLENERITPRIYESRNPTILKERILVEHREFPRFDYGEHERTPLEDSIKEDMLKEFSRAIETYDLVLLSDYDKKFFDRSFAQGILGIARSRDIPTLVDPKPKNISYFENCTIVQPNEYEAREIALTDEPCEKIVLAQESILKILSEKVPCKYAVMTAGAYKIFSYDASVNEYQSVQPLSIPKPHVAGAGDTFAATLGLGFTSGLTIHDASKLAAIASSIVVEKPGVSTVGAEELFAKLKEHKI